MQNHLQERENDFVHIDIYELQRYNNTWKAICILS